MGEGSESEIIDIKVKDNEKIKIENIELISMHTPGHTNCSYSFLMKDRVFTGDTLFSLGCGRVFEGTYSEMLLSLNIVKNLPKETSVYCGH